MEKKKKQKQLKDACGQQGRMKEGGMGLQVEATGTGQYKRPIPWYLVQSKPYGATAAATNVLTTDIMIIIIVVQGGVGAVGR